MDEPMPKVLRLPGLVLAAVLALGLVASILTLVAPGGRALIAGSSLEALSSGALTAALSHRLTAQLPGGAMLARAARILDWLVLGDLGPAVRRGCPGWLFLREELDSHPAPALAMARRADLAARVAGQLNARGIALVVAVAPDKSRIARAALCGLARPAALADRLGHFEGLLAARGVATVDLAAALDGSSAADRYYRSDTHWNETGARLAADAIAKQIGAGGLAPPAIGAAVVRPGAEVERIGDLIRLAGLAEAPAWARPAGDRVATSTIVQPPLPGDDLLGDMPGPPVVVIGSSFSRNGNFIGFLSAALAVPVGDMARDGAGFDGAARAYFADPAFRETPPRVILWEIPERVIDAPAGPDERAWAGALTAGAP